MAEKKGGGGEGDLREDPMAARVVPDPAKHQPMTALAGYLGRSTRDGYWRIYLTPEFDEYVEVAAEDVVHSEQIAAEGESLGGSRVWIRRDAAVTHTRVTSRQLQAEFLSGGIASSFLPGTATSPASGFGRLVRPNCASFRFPCDDASDFFCRTDRLTTFNLHIPACRSDAGLCGNPTARCGGGDTFGAFCPTREFVCGNTIGCTRGPECGF